MNRVDLEHCLPIVVGLDLNAELGDRPLAYRLRDAMLQWCETHKSDLSPTVCTDAFYLNCEMFHGRPAVSIGAPGANALTAHLKPRLPSILTVEDQLTIQMDADFEERCVAIWGLDRTLTETAVALFEQRYLAAYLEAMDAMR